MMDTTARDIRAYLTEHEEEMIDFLKALVLAESPSNVPEAQAGVQRLLAGALAELDFDVRRIPGRGRSGGHLYARPRRRARGRPAQLLLGHCDTVWPPGTLDEMPFEVRGDEVRGPGVFDMKGGLAMIVFALRALGTLGRTPPVTPVVFINSDEEIGSVESQSYLRMLARRVERVYVLEPALGLSGKLKTARKGVGRFVIHVRGVGAHAGLDPGAGVSAILELSHVIQKLHALNDLERGVTVNVGLIDGGQRPNVVAPVSKAVVDVRVPTREEARRVEAAIRSLKPTTPGATLTIEGRVGRPPMERTPRNRALWHAARAAARALDIPLEEGCAGGGSDGNITSLFTATLDGLGAVGEGAHARHEFAFRDKLTERCALLALLILHPSIPHPDASSHDGRASKRPEIVS
ncbi:M20 family metallopeptidase [Rhodocaloribacter sp.]